MYQTRYLAEANLKKLLEIMDKDPDLVIKSYDDEEGISILIIRSGDLGDDEYRISLELESIDDDGEHSYTELKVESSTVEGIGEIIEGYFDNCHGEESIIEILGGTKDIILRKPL